MLGRLHIWEISNASSNGTPKTALAVEFRWACFSPELGRDVNQSSEPYNRTESRLPFPNAQKERDFAFSRLSLADDESDGASFPPNLNPVGMGVPFMGPDI